jgi:DNA-binding CsgD family transcriptional regulator
VFLDAVPTPVILLGEGGRIEYANAAGRRALERRSLFRVQAGRLVAIAGDRTDWSAALRSADPESSYSFTHIEKSSVLFGTVRLSDPRRYVEYRAAWPGADRLATIELRGEAEALSAFARLAVQYRFTPMEVEVLKSLALGNSPATIARHFQVRISTVRSHLRSLYQKTGLHRQADVVRLVPPT